MSILLARCSPFLISQKEYIQRLDSVPSASADIQTLQEAEAYWQTHFSDG